MKGNKRRKNKVDRSAMYKHRIRVDKSFDQIHQASRKWNCLGRNRRVLNLRSKIGLWKQTEVIMLRPEETIYKAKAKVGLT